jgi:hypothetical protein
MSRSGRRQRAGKTRETQSSASIATSSSIEIGRFSRQVAADAAVEVPAKRAGGPGSVVVIFLISWIALVVLRYNAGAFGFYEDEGINLMKAKMVGEGYRLYREVYSDQAPLHTDLLAVVFKLFGGTVEAGRGLALLAGMGSLVLAALICAELAGPVAALVCSAVLLACAPFLKFATSVVVTTPGTCLGMAALYSVLRGGRRRGRGATIWFLASGTLLGLAIMTKLATIYFLPILAAAVVFGERTGGRLRERATALTAGAGAFLATAGLVFVLHSPGEAVRQLITPHLAALQADVRHTEIVRRLMLLAPGMLLLYLTVGAALALSIKRGFERRHLVAVGWLAVVTLWILNHRPLWAHHLPDLLLPLATTLSVAAVSCARVVWLERRDRTDIAGRIGSALVAGGVVLVLVSQVRNHPYWRRWYDGATEASLREVAGGIARHSGEQDWVIVDRPILAFLAKRRVPPELVLIAHKRIVSGGLTDQDLLASLDRYRPAVVALCTDLLTRRYRRFVGAVEQRYQTVGRWKTPGRYPSASPVGCQVVERVGSGGARLLEGGSP